MSNMLDYFLWPSQNIWTLWMFRKYLEQTWMHKKYIYRKRLSKYFDPMVVRVSALCTFLRIILLCDKSLWWLKCTTAYNYIKLLPLPTSKWSNFQFASPILCKKNQVAVLGDAKLKTWNYLLYTALKST